MCAINPKHEHHFVLSVYTSHGMTTEEFNQMVAESALNLEMKLNENGRLRWHIKGPYSGSRLNPPHGVAG
jgi:hypothetical protein